MTKTEKYLEGLTIHKVPYNIANTSDFKTNVMGKAADNELFIITDTPTFSLKIGNVTYDGTSNVSATTATQSASGSMSAADKKKLDGITVDTALSSTSTNPVQNKVIKTELNKFEKPNIKNIEYPKVRVYKWDSSSIILRAWVWGKDVFQSYDNLYKLNYNLKKEFDKNNIEIPYNHLNVIMEDDKDTK